MTAIYAIVTQLAEWSIRLLGLVNPKLRSWVNGHKQSWKILDKLRPNGRKVVWVHVASLGEYQQAVPVLKALRDHETNPYLVVTFFSASGYEVVKNKVVADVACYLPLDTPFNAERFVAKVRPTIALFVKYEIWPNYLRVLTRHKVKHFLIAARFYEGQPLFQYAFGRKLLDSFEALLCQDEHSLDLAQKMLPSKKALLSGDTRFDQVITLAENEQQLEVIEAFKNGRFCLIIGSSWHEEEVLIAQYLREHVDDHFCVIIAPHKTSLNRIAQLKTTINERVALWSERETNIQCRVLVIDTIGLLNQVYQSADVAFVGGGFRSGLHNTLEPAALGIPVLIGPKYETFPEVKSLVECEGVLALSDYNDFESALLNFIKQPELMRQMGQINVEFVKKNGGATQRILAFIEEYLR
jgi:3-deoxy-D-manno-octulosonic-acid transferase